MCRWMAYSGAPLRLEDLILKPEHNLIDMSLSASLGPNTTNGDGFGIGWYGDRPEPGVYREITPAWNDDNLRSLCAQISSRLFMAHVRDAGGQLVQQTNSHPFAWDRWLFMHNGSIAEYPRLRRELLMAVDADLFPLVRGTTDSEIMFYLAITFGLATEPFEALERMVWFVEKVGRGRGVESPLVMTVALSDGEGLLAARYSSGQDTRTLFHSRDMRSLKALAPKALAGFDDDAIAVASEPLGSHGDTVWVEIPEGTAILVSGLNVTRRSFGPRPVE